MTKKPKSLAFGQAGLLPSFGWSEKLRSRARRSLTAKASGTGRNTTRMVAGCGNPFDLSSLVMRHLAGAIAEIVRSGLTESGQRGLGKIATRSSES